MRSILVPLLLATAVTGCASGTPGHPARGVEPVNVPVLARTDYAFDAAAPSGSLDPMELARLDGWFRGLNLGYGDAIYVDGGYAEAARAQVAQLAGNYGMMVSPGAPVVQGAVNPGTVRVVVSRSRAHVPGCPNWSEPSQPNFDNRMISNFGCAVNSNLAAMVANPQDLIHGREGSGVTDAVTATKAVGLYRSAEPTGSQGLKDISTKKDDQ